MPEEMDTVTESVPEDDGSANPAVSDDFVGDTEAEDTRDAAAQTPEGNSTPFDPEQVDLLRTNVEDVPADQRPFFEKWQKMGRGLYKTVEERVKSENRTAVDEANRRATEAEQKYLTRLESLGQQAAPDPYAHLSSDEQQGISVVKSIAKEEVGALPETVSGLKQQMDTVINYLQQQNTKVVQDEISAVSSDPEFANYRQPVMALMAQTNPLTAKHYTAQEAFELLSGKTAEKAEELREADRNIRSKTKRRGQAPAAVASNMDDGGDMSENEALAAMENLFQ